jgi:bifunctional N-acetylglucosamine-1-phosphate-uridyltransferase/glucosamine-1-phosphate-acetyltransferase GlmU-like protein
LQEIRPKYKHLKKKRKKIGNFCRGKKKSTIGKKAQKVNHLSYIGDANYW